MPALNVEFSEEELDELRELAREQGVTLKALVRASTADQIARHRALKEGSDTFARTFHDPALAEAIAAAGLDDGPTITSAGQAA
ncbi:hypothetical protein OKJ48_09760 [Streptomyces kunmingensis]|uniref:Ribbon-helix-helix protein CopG domain-containing protein n=1 Tax=Streptomyces kunmingensis TaxID=68225 RepID=A0ABU6C9M0_9ACTN|nr:hypothetical protein [Streptomyces kunmingensis]MEB3960530.1 hypothetical protein [Streptomyces kunmingensis]